VPGFQQLLQQEGGDLQRFYAAVRARAHDKGARRELCRAAVELEDTKAALGTTAHAD